MDGRKMMAMEGEGLYAIVLDGRRKKTEILGPSKRVKHVVFRPKVRFLL
jgi:hypothetical protein